MYSFNEKFDDFNTLTLSYLTSVTFQKPRKNFKIQILYLFFIEKYMYYILTIEILKENLIQFIIIVNK